MDLAAPTATPSFGGERSRTRRALGVLSYAIAPLALVALGFVLFPAAGRDDAHIACWPAHMLATRGAILNYNGEHVEQGSSLSWVLLLAALEKITGAGTATLAREASIAAGMLVILLCQAIGYRLGGRRAAVLAGLLIASSPDALYWMFGGLETPFYALLLTGSAWLAAVHAERRSSFTGFALVSAACVASRPEAAFTLLTALVLGLGLHALRDARGWQAVLRAELSRWLWLAAWTLLMAALLTAFRKLYFHAFFPQPVSAKEGGTLLDALHSGKRYLLETLQNPGQALSLLSLALLGSWVCLRRADARLHMLLGLAGAQLAFAVASGGDWMEAGRFLVPLLPAAAILSALALYTCVSAAGTRALLVGALLLAQLVGIAWTARTESTSAPLFAHIPTRGKVAADVDATLSFFERNNRVHVREIPMIERLGHVMDTVYSRKHAPVVLLSGQMGMVSFHVVGPRMARVRLIDKFGLADRALTSCPLTRSYGHNAGGIDFSFREFFAHEQEFEQGCGVPRPDVLYDRGVATVECPADFLPLYQQRGKVLNDSRWFPGRGISAELFICVRRALWPNPESTPLEDFTWPAPFAGHSHV